MNAFLNTKSEKIIRWLLIFCFAQTVVAMELPQSKEQVSRSEEKQFQELLTLFTHIRLNGQELSSTQLNQFTPTVEHLARLQKSTSCKDWLELAKILIVSRRDEEAAGIAMSQLARVLRYTNDDELRAEAWICLARMHHHGLAIEPDSIQAATYFIRAADQCRNKQAQALAWRYLGEKECLDAHNQMTTNSRRLTNALKFFKNALNQTTFESEKARLCLRIGQIHQIGLKTRTILPYEAAIRVPEMLQANSFLQKAYLQVDCKWSQAEAACCLGQNRAQGKGQVKDLNEAISYLTVATSQIEHAFAKWEATCWLGKIYYEQKLFCKARDCFEDCADQAIHRRAQAEAWLCLGELSYHGHGELQELEKAKEYFLKAEKQLVDGWVRAKAALYLGKIALDAHEEGEAALYFSRALLQRANKGVHASAMQGLRAIAMSEKGVSFLIQKLRNTPDDSFRTRLAQVNFELALLFYENEPQDYKKARSFFEKVSQQTANRILQARAWYFLGEIHFLGEGVEEDNARALEYYRDAANQEHDAYANAQACSRLAEIYYNGYVGPNDYHSAATWCEKALRQRVSKVARVEAAFYLAVISYCGHTGFKDFHRALELFMIVKNEDTDNFRCFDACSYLGEIYLHGLGVPADCQKARELFILAAEQDENPRAQEYAWQYLGKLAYKPGDYNGAKK